MTFSMLAVVVCALAIGNDAAPQQEMTPPKQKMKMNSVTAAVGHIGAHGDVSVQGESAQRLVRRAPKPANLLVRSFKKAKEGETCEEWSETHATHAQAHRDDETYNAHSLHSHNYGCPEGYTRNLDAGILYDPVPLADDGSVDEDEAMAECCEAMSTCLHFWQHHHNHNFSEHRGNHGCPYGMTQKENAGSDEIDPTGQSHDEIVEICCEDDEEDHTCQHFWDHHTGRGHDNHGCPPGMNHRDNAREDEIGSELSHDETVEICCEYDTVETCAHFWHHHNNHASGHGNHGCPEGETQRLSANTDPIHGETHEQQVNTCCESDGSVGFGS